MQVLVYTFKPAPIPPVYLVRVLVIGKGSECLDAVDSLGLCRLFW